MWSQDNILVLTAAKSAEKGGGVNAVLGLMQDMIMFMGKVEATAEAQDLAENKQKLEGLYKNLADSYAVLLGIARGGVQSMKQSVQAKPEQPQLSDPNRIEQLP